MEASPILVAIREDLARLEAAAAASPPLDEQAMADLYPLLTAAQDALGKLAEALQRRGSGAKPTHLERGTALRYCGVRSMIEHRGKAT